MQNWDLLVLDPIICVIGFGVLFFMIYKERISGRQIFFFAEMLLVWIANGIMTKMLANRITLFQTSLSDTAFAVCLIVSGLLVAVFLKPLATWLTGKIHNRRIWMWAAYGTTILSIILMMANTHNNVPLYILASIIFGFSLSASSLYYLFLNEQYYYRVNPVAVGFVVAIIMVFAAFIGIYLVHLNLAYYNNATFTFNFVYAIGLVFTIFAIGFAFAKKENSGFVGSFDEQTRQMFSPKNVPAFVLLSVATVFVAFANQITHGLINNFFIAFMLKKDGVENNQIQSILNVIELMPYALSTIFGYIMYRYLFKAMGYKYYLTTSLFFIFVCYTLMAFTHNGWLMLFFNFVSGFFASQVLFTLFSVAIFRNYQINNIPLTGYVAGAMQLGIFADSVIENLLIKKGVSILGTYNSIPSILTNFDQSKYQTQFDDFNVLITAIFCIMACLTLLTVLIIYFNSNKIFVDFSDLKKALINQKNILRKNMVERTKTPVALSDIK